MQEEHLTEAELSRRVAELSRVQRIGRVGGFEIDLRGGQFLNYRSPEYLSVHRLSAQAAQEAHEAWVQRMHPEDRERAEAHFKNCVAGNARHYASEYRILIPGEGVRWISAVAEIDRDENGAPLRMVGVHIDITRTKMAEAALRSSELALKETEQRLRDLNAGLERLAEERARALAASRAQLQAFFDNSPDWLTLQRCTPEGQFVYVDINPTCEKAYGLSRAEVIGRRVEEVLGEEEALVPIAHFKECVRTGRPQRYVTHRTMAGTKSFIDVIAALVPGSDDNGDVFLLTSARDLTERERLETQLRQAQRLDAVGQLTGSVAHDFNNLLTVILGNATLLKKGTSKQPDKLIDNILIAGERGGALTRQLLSLARNRPLNRQVVDLTGHMSRIAGLLRSSLRGDIDMRVAIDPATWSIDIDIGELEIALLNVAVNARDAMPSGGVFTVDIRNLDPEHDIVDLPPSMHGFVAITMRDNGAGMSPEVAARAFEPFFTTKELGSGTGLGLSQVFNFARASGGAARLESQIDQGTQISIFLPSTDKPVTDIPFYDGAAYTPPLAGRVLLVDDNADVMAVVESMIEAMGIEVESVQQATSALERLADRPKEFDLLLTDVVMPGMNGVDLAREVLASWPQLPVVLMSGYNDAPPPPEFQVLRKPISYEALYDVMRRLLTGASDVDGTPSGAP
jgi:PAS domain S-box-containing protein